jgi:hypothetical protein
MMSKMANLGLGSTRHEKLRQKSIITRIMGKAVVGVTEAAGRVDPRPLFLVVSAVDSSSRAMACSDMGSAPSTSSTEGCRSSSPPRTRRLGCTACQPCHSGRMRGRDFELLLDSHALRTLT